MMCGVLHNVYSLLCVECCLYFNIIRDLHTVLVINSNDCVLFKLLLISIQYSILAIAAASK